MEVLLVAVPIAVTPEGRGALPFEPKNHSKAGIGTLEGRGTG